MIHSTIKPLFNTALNRSHPLAQGLVSMWNFSEGCGDLIHDSCGMNDGKTSGMAPMSGTSGWVPGPHGAALAFDGVDDYVDLPVSGIILGTTPRTFVGWITPVVSAGTFPIYTGGGGGGVRTNFSIYGGIAINGSVYVSYNDADFYTASILDINLHQVVAVYGGGLASDTKIYVDGISKAIVGTAGSPASAINTTAVYHYLGKSWDGWVDRAPIFSSASIYNRALSAGEIAYLYAFPWCMYDRPASAWEYNQQNRNFDHYYRRLMAA